jgi:NADH-quinone oxidoreductase subunit E
MWTDEEDEVLTAAESGEIEQLLKHYPVRDSVAIDALKIVQRHRGWISDEALKDLADFIGMTPADLDGVATFYNLLFRKPVGRHVITVCDSVSCWIMGYENIREQLFSKLGIQYGQTTPDGRFTLLPIVCLGACDRAPVMMVDGDTHGRLTASNLDGILERYR